MREPAPERSGLLGAVIQRIGQQATAITVFLVCFAATTVVVAQLDRLITTKDEERFANAVDRLDEAVKRRIATYLDMLRATAGMLDVEEAADRRTFQAFVTRLDLQRRYPGIRGVGFSQRIVSDDLPRVAAALRGEQPGFRVWPETPRPEYYPVVYVEPLDPRSQRALGYDMFTEQTRRAAMERARDTGEASATGPLVLVQEPDETRQQQGFLIYTPVYSRGGVPPSVEERRPRLRGFVYGAFRVGDLFAGILGAEREPRAGFQLADSTTPERVFYRTGDAAAGGFRAVRELDVAGRTWTVEYFPLPGLARTSYAGLLPAVLWTGLALTTVLAVLVALQSAARARLEVSERETQAASRRFQQAERAAREHAETLELVNATGAQLAAELDLHRLLQALTDAGVRLTRAQFGAFFYNVVEASGEQYTLYTVSGLPQTAFESFALPRNTAVFGPTFRGEGIVRSDDITADPRYGPDAPTLRLPPGHPPMRSYLAVPVVSRSGEVLGGLFFGHAVRGCFDQQHERMLAGVAALAGVAIDNARLYNRVHDLLERERAARTEAEHVSHMKDEFLATLSHELRTPLNAVIGWTQLLRQGGVPEARYAQALDTIQRNAEAQSRLIDDLLDMSRIVSGRLRMETAEVQLAEVVSAAVAIVRPAADAKGVVITTEGERVPLVRGDAARLQQVFWNLLSNAVKFTPAGGRVDVRIARRDGHVGVEVRDTGMGITPEFLPYVFDRFRQADVSTRREQGGLGLGLSIVRSLVQMHGGTVTVHSEGPGRGAAFTVTLPERPAEPAALAI